MTCRRASIVPAESVLLAAVTLVSAPATAQVFLPENPGPDAGWDYVVAPLTANCVEDYRLYLPQGTPPSTGWPVLIHLDLHSFVNTTDFDQLDATAPPTAPDADTQHLLAKVLMHGIAVITARATPARLFNDPLWHTPQVNPPVPALCPNDPPPTHATLPGHGMFHLPGVETTDECCGPWTGCSGASGSPVKPYDERAWSMAEKDAMMLVQHVRFGARQASGRLAVLDHRRIAVHSASSGAAAMMWATFGPDRRGPEPLPKDHLGTGSQYDESTRPDMAVLEHGAVWWPLYDEDLGAPHFANGGHADCPAQFGYQVDPEDKMKGSALFYEDTAMNPNLPLLLAYNQVNVAPGPGVQDCFNYCKTFVPPPTCPPFTIACEDFANKAHARWNGFAWKLLYPLRTELQIWRPDTSWPLISTAEQCPSIPCLPAGGCVAIDNSIVGVDALHDRMVNWLLTNLVQSAPAVWFTIITAKPNNDDCQAPMTVGVPHPITGMPQLSGTGTFVPGTPLRFTVTGAAPGSSAGLFVGKGNDIAPNGEFNSYLKGRPCVAQYGGVSVPALDDLIPMPTVQANGTSTVQFPWPATSLPAAERYFQVWLLDGSVVYATNALMSRAP